MGLKSSAGWADDTSISHMLRADVTSWKLLEGQFDTAGISVDL